MADAYFPPPSDKVIESAVELLRAEWHPIPVPWGIKKPEITGVTGHEGVDLDEQGVYTVFRNLKHIQLGSRMPRGLIGIDVDQYEEKRGWDKLEEFRITRGLRPLPPTAMSTSRTWPSGIRFFRVAEGIRFRGAPLPGIEIIQRHHRFTMCYPSVHPKTGETYRWISAHGEVLDGPPRLDEGQIATLPWSWVEALRKDGEADEGRPHAEWENAVGLAEMDPDVERIVRQVKEAAESGESRHDAMHRALCALWRMDEEGLSGTQTAMDELRDWFVDEVAPDRGDGDRGRRTALAEFNRSMRDGLSFIKTHKPRPAPGVEDMLGMLDELAKERVQAPSKEIHDEVVEESSKELVEDEPWPEPEPINLVEVPPFPMEVLPPWMQVWCEDVATSIQTPIDLPAMCALGVLSVLSTRRVFVQVKSTYTEPANLYLTVGMLPSSGKSPVFKKAIAPLEAFEAELRSRAKREVAEHEAKTKIAEKALKDAQSNGNLIEIADCQLALNELEDNAPWLPQLLADDQTPEAFVELLDRHGRIALVSSEGDLFDMMDRYTDNKKAQLAPYLKAWSGDAITVNRKSAKQPMIIKDALATVCITVQPSVLADMGTRKDFSARGLPQRFMYSMPRSIVGERDYLNAPDGDPRVDELWNDRILTLAKSISPEPRRLVLTAEARALFNTWKQRMEQRRRAGGDLEELAEWSTKCESSVIRLAGLLWLADGGEGGQISAGVMARALRVGDYWIGHAKVVLGLWFPEEDHSDASDVMRIIRKKNLTGVTVRQIMRTNPRRYDSKERVEDAMELLEAKGWVRPSRHPTRPSVKHWETRLTLDSRLSSDASRLRNALIKASEGSPEGEVSAQSGVCLGILFDPSSLPTHPSRGGDTEVPGKRLTEQTLLGSAGSRPHADDLFTFDL